MAVKEKQLIESKQNRGKTDERQESLSLEHTVPGWMVYFPKWDVGFVI